MSELRGNAGPCWRGGSGIIVGLVLGSVIGQLLFDSVAMGIGVGLAFGIALDMAMPRGHRRPDPAGASSPDA